MPDNDNRISSRDLRESGPEGGRRELGPSDDFAAHDSSEDSLLDGLALLDEKSVLKERARRLATPPISESLERATLKVVQFVLAHETYGIPVEYVSGVHSLTELTPVPCAPDFVLGIVRIRGEIMSVMDVRQFFDLPNKGITDLSKVIVLRNDHMELGILADSIAGVRNVPLEGLHSELSTLAGLGQDYLLGVTTDRLIVINAQKLLSDHRIVVNQEAAE